MFALFISRLPSLLEPIEGTTAAHEVGVVRGIRARDIESVQLLTSDMSLEFTVTMDPMHAREMDPIGNLIFRVPVLRPDTPLPVVRVRFRNNVTATLPLTEQ